MTRPGSLSATALVIASMVGTGIFTSLGFQLEDLPSGPAIITLWLVGGVIALCGALCYAALARLLPRSGGEHHFLTELYHPALGFMAGLVSAIVGFAAPTALSALALGEYLRQAFPALPVPAAATAVILIGTLAHSSSAATSARVQTAATALKLLLILGLILAAIVLPGRGDIRWSPDPATDLGAVLQPAFATALFFVFYSYSGWNAAIYGLEEWHQPERTVRRALVGGTLLVTALYLALNTAFLHAAPVSALSGEPAVGQIAARHLFGDDAARPLALLFALGLFASVSAMLWAGPRVLAAMGRSLPALGFFDPGPRPPRVALATQTALALAFVAFAGFRDLVTFTQAGLTTCSMFAVAGLFRLRDRLGPGEIVLLGVAATVFLAMSGFVVIRSIQADPLPTLAALAVVAASALLWFPLQRS